MVAVLTRTVDAVDEVFGYSGTGIMFITESGHLAYVAASAAQGGWRSPGGGRARPMLRLLRLRPESSAATCARRPLAGPAAAW